MCRNCAAEFLYGSSPHLSILRELQPLTGKGTWVFPGVRTNGEPMSENTVNATLRRLGYDRTMITARAWLAL